MITLSPRAKEAIKTALAMTIAYGIALWMDWDKPIWAGFAVAFISLSTVGQSLNKGGMRMLGTLLAAVFSLTLLALFPQERWWFMGCLSIFIGICTYMMGGSRHQYFWNVAGFVSAIICMESVPATDNGFQLAVLRTLETGLGILVYTLVTVLLWPTSTRGEMDASVRQLAATQHELYRRYRKLLDGEGAEEEIRPLRMREVQQFNQFSQALLAARTDSYEVWEVRREWRQVENQAAAVMEALERWRESFAEVKELELEALLPNLVPFAEEVDGRFEQIERMLEDKPPEGFPQVMDPALNRQAVSALPYFQKAALAVTRTQLRRLETLTRSLFETLAHIKGFGTASAQSQEAVTPPTGFVLDPDRIAAAVRVMAGLWLAYMVWIYTEVPGGTGFVTMAVPFGMALAIRPQVSVSMLFTPAAVSISAASILYIFVMPRLSSFTGLGLLIFAVTFAICYLFHTPRQGLSRTLGLVMFVTIAGISNQQTYNFLSVANTALMFPLLFVLLAFTAYIPVSPRPEKAFPRLLGRFFRGGEYLMSTMRWDPTGRPTRFDRWKRAFHAREVETLPRKLAVWGDALDTRVLPGATPARVQALTTALQGLAYRMQELLEARDNPQAELLVRELLADFRAWRVKVQGTFNSLSQDPTATPAVEKLREGLAGILGHMEQRIQETLDKAAEGELTDQDGERFYRLLGAYRGVSEAACDYAGIAGDIDWSQWREARF